MIGVIIVKIASYWFCAVVSAFIGFATAAILHTAKQDERENQFTYRDPDGLKHCPFCGRKTLMTLMANEYDEFWFRIHGGFLEDECNCGVVMESLRFELDADETIEESELAQRFKTELIERWNSRVNLS